MRRRLGYLHVPKTAGTSVSAAIRAAVADGRPDGDADRATVAPYVMDTTLFGDFTGFDRITADHGVFLGDPADLAGHDAVLGHFAVTTLLAGREPDDLLALFREPRARLLSLYTYWRSWPEHKHASWDPYDASRAAARLDWPDFLTAPSVAAQVDNAATRLLLAPHPLIPTDGVIAPADVAPLLDDALAALDRLGHVDVIERGPACWHDLSAWLGVDVEVGHERRTDDGAALDPRTHFTEASEDALAARTVLDAAVWRRAGERHGLDATTLDHTADRTWAERSEAATGSAPADDAPGARAAGAGGSGVSRRAGDAWRRATRRRADR